MNYITFLLQNAKTYICVSDKEKAKFKKLI